MKLPFYTLFGPYMKCHYSTLRCTCSHGLLCHSCVYTIFLGVLGVLFSTFDILMLMKCGPILPGYLIRVREDYGGFIRPTVERDVKLIALLISFEYYLLLVMGMSSKHPIFFLPFLTLYAFIICMEIIRTVLTFVTDGFRINKCNMWTALFVVFNWLSVFCCFWRHLDYCDY